MTRPLDPTTRESSTTSSSALSNIQVAGGAMDDDNASEAAAASTPPTSLGDASSIASGKDEAGPSGRAKRARSSVNYNLKTLSDQQQEEDAGQAAKRRSISGLTGRTLVDDAEGERSAKPKAAAKKSSLTESIPADLPPRPVSRQQSVKDRVKSVAGKVSSVLGKRSRDVMEAGKRKLEEVTVKKTKLLKELEMGPRGVLDEIDLEALEEELERPSKKAKKEVVKEEAPAPMTQPLPVIKASTGKREKKWQKEGLYVGQTANPDSTQSGASRKLSKQRPSSAMSDAPAPMTSKLPFLPLPMFDYMTKQRDFVIPYDVFAPSVTKHHQKPRDWTQVNKNRLIGDAKDIWKRRAQAKALPRSLCGCEQPAEGEGHGCGEWCLNRSMQYECSEENCLLSPEDCGNRAFAELGKRLEKKGAYDVGVEVLATGNRGFGVRACRAFTPGDIVMEYTGEIISEGECQRRMHEVYNGKDNYYLMELDGGLVIDGTKGSMARFVNHSCEPNCEVRMCLVGGTPRMGVFAGENGVKTGEELTYDYNFDNFGQTRQRCYCGAPSCRGFLCARLSKDELKKWQKEESERLAKVQAEAEKKVRDAAKAKAEGGKKAGWRGWVTLGDIKDDLKKELEAKAEREKGSVRAARLEARRSGVPLKRTAEAVEVKQPKRRRTTKTVVEFSVKDVVGDDAAGADDGVKEEASPSASPIMAPEPGIDQAVHEITASADTAIEPKDSAATKAPPPTTEAREPKPESSTYRPTHKRTHSTLSTGTSKFTEALPSNSTISRPTTAPSVSETLSKADEVAPLLASSATSLVSLNEDDVLTIDEEPAKKRRKFGEMLKGVAGAVGRGLGGGVGTKGKGKMDGKGLKQSTLNFGKVGNAA
ncbi:hypothetical protein B0A48_13067 [Cryoendolithus antarcticus]|uniref:SET domain-containing protein n=1 Tax=Cryoendolithus antarcticus TaxID=1507870 RepID=A0A1V8SN27_9PEZI|nr:hypothetical protein B0A48_13067 [Cryoendolithus antarcticus]